MKSICVGLLCLLGCTVLAWAGEPPEADVKPVLFYEDTTANLILSSIIKLNWFQAQAACASMGAHLVSFANQEAQNAVVTFLIASGLWNELTEPLWTSGSNLANAREWMWLDTGKPMTYRNFRTQPSTSYNCVGFNAQTSFWTAESCNTLRYFVCKKTAYTCE
ncbi:snaclec bothroinsularin subunit beta-like [Drosophila grimshawi]|uniref:snaclec bothroinsularin subunit beta-like n=1 Tax=Drosophila grimshawi TaxID=7222 RepID=UPI0013EF2FB0|nr:snaclec bothroinsularin subunit beta-like [Drosophila grimshawi]